LEGEDGGRDEDGSGEELRSGVENEDEGAALMMFTADDEECTPGVRWRDTSVETVSEQSREPSSSTHYVWGW
jgi:hypothetical protein